MVAEYDEFKSLRKDVEEIKTKEQLRSVMIAKLSAPSGKAVGKKKAEPVEDEEDEKPVKKGKEIPAKKEVKEKKKSTRTGDPSKSNKGMIYLAWKKGKTNAEKLHALVEERVQLSTIKLWMKKWEKGKGLPAVAKDNE
jgi:hypothetical protein